MKLYYDNKYNFYELFNSENGTLIRSNILNTEDEPGRRSFPELLDIGIMGSCEAGKSGICKNSGIDCYQSAYESINKDMSVEDFDWILSQCQNKVFQIALGGAGDPNKHKDFKDFLCIAKENDIVPNLTTSGFELKVEEIKLIKEYCGAVAVSFYSRLKDGDETNPCTIDAIEKFVNEGCVTNIHYVISKNSIDEAIYRLENDLWPEGINAIIFILYKPVGFGVQSKIISSGEQLNKFLDLAVGKKHRYKIGFDTCFTSALCWHDKEISENSIDSCEAARFSMYIDSLLNAYPCSFDNQDKNYSIKLRPKTIQDAWDSDVFVNFCNYRKDKCIDCMKYKICKGGCLLNLNIDLC